MRVGLGPSDKVEIPTYVTAVDSVDNERTNVWSPEIKKVEPSSVTVEVIETDSQLICG